MKKANPIICTNPQLEKVSQLVAGARSQLAELEVEFARERARVNAVQAELFRRLRELNQKRDRLRLAVHYRQKFLDSFLRNDTDEVEQAERDLAQAKVRLDQDYEEMASAAEKTKELSTEQEAELTHLWKTLVKLYLPNGYTPGPDTLETYRKLTTAINQAKDGADIETLREIAGDPQGFLLRQGWAKLDFSGVEELAQLKPLHKTLQMEMAAVAASLKELRNSTDYELCRLAEQEPTQFAELAEARARQVETENAELESRVEQLAKEIRKLGGKA